MINIITLFFILLFPVLSKAAVNVTPQMAIDEEKAGHHQKAIELFSQLADNGDSKAMIHIGSKYYSGDGVTQNYQKAMDWWLKAFKANNGDAPGNIGVLYRDGKGVNQNRKIAYLLFLFTHMENLGTESTQIRVNSNLRREIAELPKKEIEEALCYTWEYVLAYVTAKGSLTMIPKDALPAAGKIRFKDNNWWLDSERKEMTFACPSPWN